ncbi:MAG: hypothetical protein GF350_01955 [Chitinivibrionales bacterium]|nr:hypothetical protein [Chitinivibrionales bacterium]
MSKKTTTHEKDSSALPSHEVDANARELRAPAVTMFVDIIGSSVLANTLDLIDYSKVVFEFQRITSRVLHDKIAKLKNIGAQSEADVKGDEVFLISYLPEYYQNKSDISELDSGYAYPGADNEKQLGQLCSIVISAALDIKRFWLLSKVNCNRISSRQEPIGVGIGINFGDVHVGKHPRLKKIGENNFAIEEVRSPEGYIINLTKRIEGQSRTGTFSRIFVGQMIYNLVVERFQIAFTKPRHVELKGFIEPIPVYELKCAGHVEETDMILKLEEDYLDSILGNSHSGDHIIKKAERLFNNAVASNLSNFWLILDMAHHYFDKENYAKAIDLYNKALFVDDSFIPGRMYLGRCYYRLYDDSQAEQHLREAVCRNPESARSNNFLGVCLRRLALRARFEKDFKRCHELLIEAISFHSRSIKRANKRDGFFWGYIAKGHTLAELAALHNLLEEDSVSNREELQELLGNGQKDELILQLEDAEREIGDSLNSIGNPYLVKHTLGFIKHELWLLYHKKRHSMKGRDKYDEAHDAYEEARIRTLLKYIDNALVSFNIGNCKRHFKSIHIKEVKNGKVHVELKEDKGSNTGKNVHHKLDTNKILITGTGIRDVKINDLDEHISNHGKMKFYEKMSEIERHFGSLYYGGDKDDSKSQKAAHHHYQQAFACLKQLQLVRSRRNRSNPDNGASGYSDCNYQRKKDIDGFCNPNECQSDCIPCWWKDTLERIKMLQ